MFPINDIGFQVWILWCAVGPPSSRLSGSMVFVYGEPTLRRLCAAFSSSPFMFGRRKRWGEKISFEAWAKFSCALVVSVKQISGPLLLYDDRVYRWVSSSRTNQIVGGSPPRPNIESTVALLLVTTNQIVGGSSHRRGIKSSVAFCRGGSIRMLLLLKSKG
ncbi:unnamed protein product [Brassica napus]|uniref:(rape) hypothetical protein n=1 Tax=Brassica napus TaxID=3708 RepID=A0A816ULJ0_BRANA|nr:unnamed protein product [Brassica napus]